MRIQKFKRMCDMAAPLVCGPCGAGAPNANLAHTFQPPTHGCAKTG